MRRLLIVDSGCYLADAVKRQLTDRFDIKHCDDGQKALECICAFSPDIVLIDLHLPKINGLDLLYALRNTGNTAKVIVISGFVDTYVVNRLADLEVTQLFLKPYGINAVISSICDVAFALEFPCEGSWCVENEIDRILCSLGVRIGPSRYSYLCQGILRKYEQPNASVTKCLYPEVAKLLGGTATQVEKAIRDAIKDGWRNGNEQIWNLYFPSVGGERRCPSNEQFLARIGNILQQKARVKMPESRVWKIAK